MNDAIVEKIRKCLALANGMNAAPGEIEAAFAKAQEIARRHQIDISSIKVEDPSSSANADPIGEETSLRTRSEYVQPYHRYLFIIFRECLGVRSILFSRSSASGKQYSKIVLIGTSSDLLLAKILWPWLEALFPRTLSRAVGAGMLTYSAADMNGCYLGLCRGIIAANRREEEKMEQKDAQQWALVVQSKTAATEEWIKAHYPDCKPAAARSRHINHQAHEYGKSVGGNVRLQQIGSSTSATSLPCS